ncbi:alpha/beta fold hydrolase [Microlunatus soli]|uniref:Alpha/beta hydrolase family protein n=1 Tax=Microlunatus soli TaxID=630515 RepID=A0A1H1N360_9ACTN|nr:alpha/beta hydrolase [Microlunatus soli]SDR93493.1 hypothetical protein SAMN04489812_0363 [Microlunatus soli]
MARVIMIPGLAVRRYLEPSVEALCKDGHQVELLQPLGWRSTGTDLRRYARRFARQSRDPVDLLVGCSIGTQAAVLAAGEMDVRQLLLISPTLDPARRSLRTALAAWLGGEGHRHSPRLGVQSQDWLRAGLFGIERGLRSAIDVRLEDELPNVSVPFTIVHGDTDRISPLPFAADLAVGCGGRLMIMPDAPHSWPVGDGDRYRSLVDRLISSHRDDAPPIAPG